MLGKTNILRLSEAAIASAVDDFTWIPVTSGVSGNFRKAIYENGILAAFTEDGTIVYTTDGETWNTTTLELESYTLLDVVWDGSRFVLVGSHTEDSVTYGLIVTTTDFATFELRTKISDSSSSYDRSHKLFGVYYKNGKYIVLGVNFAVPGGDAVRVTLFSWVGDLDAWETKTQLKQLAYGTNYSDPSYHEGNIAKNSTGFIISLKSGGGYTYVFTSTDGLEFKERTSDFDEVSVFECKDYLYYMYLTSAYGHRLVKIINTEEESVMSSDKNFAFLDGVYFDNAQVFMNSHSILVVKKGESITDKAVSDMKEIASETSMNIITKAFGNIYTFGNQGVVLKSSTEVQDDNAVVVKTLAAKKALEDAIKYNEQSAASAQVATEKASEAAASAEAAGNSETAAANSASSASTSETNAAKSAEEAQNAVQTITDNVSLLGALRVKDTGTGEIIHLSDSAEGKPVEFALYGKAKQDSTSGKNLLDLNAHPLYSFVATAKYSEPILTLTKTSSDDHSFVLYQLGTVEELVDKMVYMNGYYTGNSARIVLGYADPDGANRVSIKQKDAINGNFDMSILVDATYIGKKVCVWFYVDTSKDGTAGDIGTYSNVIVSTEENATYEPYTGGIASPNPDYPQEIEVAGASGSVEVKSTGKNLWTGETLPLYIDSASRKAQTSASAQSPYIKCIEGVTYTIQKKAGTRFIVATFADIPSYGMGSIESIAIGNASALTITPSKGSKYLMAWVWNEGTDTDITLEEMLATVQIEYGDTATSYESPKGTISTIPTPNGLPGIPVSSNGNYTDADGQQWVSDEIVKYADGSGKYVQRVLQTVFDGSSDEVWYANGPIENGKYRVKLDNTSISILKNKDSDTLSNVVCSHYVAKMPADTYRGYQGISVDKNGKLIIYDDNYNTSDITLWNSYLAENPIECLFILAEPVITDLTSEQIAEIEKLSTFYPVTNISNDADCGMEVTYIADTKLYIDKRIAALETALVNSI